MNHRALILSFIFVASAFANNVLAQNYDKNDPPLLITDKGNKLELAYRGEMDTLSILDPITGDVVYKYIQVDQPISINGQKIYAINEVIIAPIPELPYASLEQYILTALKNDALLALLPDGHLRLRVYNIIINQQGKIIYYDFDNVYFADTAKFVRTANSDFAMNIDNIFANAPAMKPATVNGKPVIYCINRSMPQAHTIIIKDHVISHLPGVDNYFNNSYE